MVDYFTLTPEKTLRKLNTSTQGLTEGEASRRLEHYGTNALVKARKVSALKIFIVQFNNFLVWILLVAVIISAFIGEVVESIIIGIIILINAAIGFVQEFRAEKAVEALKKLVGLNAEVLRNGERKNVSAKNLVPGDVIFVKTGDKISADCRLLEESNLEILESSLTGESTPVKKDAGAIEIFTGVAIADQHNMIFSGTTVTKGRGKAAVVKTGMHAEVGKIAKLIDETEEDLTPLQKKLATFAKQIGIVTMVIAAIVFVVAWLRRDYPIGEKFLLGMLPLEKFSLPLAGVVDEVLLLGVLPLETFKTAVSLAVAAVPEGLPAVVAMALALGIQRMIKRNALIRKLPSVETLGSTTVIATDKTGTLTLDKMTVKKLYVNQKIFDVAGFGYSVKEKLFLGENGKLLLRIGALCNNSALEKEKVFGDPTEAALLVSAEKAGLLKKDLEKGFRRVDEIPFDSKTKRMTTIHQSPKGKVAYMKGAPDVILNLCDRIFVNGKIEKMTDAHKRKVHRVNETFASQALRVLGFAYSPVKEMEKNMVFVGLQAMLDPPRPEVKPAIEKCKKAGIRVVMITGDHKLTAVAIARKVGIGGAAVTGEELDRMENPEDRIGEIGVYARVSPEHKIKIITALKNKKEVVAMTGDGVNDAPALKKADIGIAMGITGTDVAKEASKMILTDDNFASIVNSVEEGRGIFKNIKKFVYFLLSSNLAEVMIIFFAIIAGLKLPLVAIQILWVNLVTDGLPAIALGVEPAGKDIMNAKPRKTNEKIMDRSMVVRLVLVGITITIGTLAAYLWAFNWSQGQEHVKDPYLYASTMAFATLVIFEMFNAIASKSESRLMLSGFFNNKWLLAAIASSLALLGAVLYTPLNKHFHVTFEPMLDPVHLGIVFLAGFSILIVDSLYKLWLRTPAGKPS